MTTERVLIVEDDPHLLKFVEDALKIADYEVRSAGDGEEALAVLARWRPHVILLDLNMPRKDGREALREIKSDPALRAIPVIVLTTSRAEEDIYRTYDLGVSSFISKPVSFEGLMEVMRALGRYWFEIVELPSDGRGG